MFRPLFKPCTRLMLNASVASRICCHHAVQQGLGSVRSQPRPVRPLCAQQITCKTEGVDAVPMDLVASPFDKGHPLVSEQKVVGVSRLLNPLR